MTIPLPTSGHRTSGKRRTSFSALGNVLFFPCHSLVIPLSFFSNIQSNRTHSFFPGGQHTSLPDWLARLRLRVKIGWAECHFCTVVIGVFTHAICAPSPSYQSPIAIDRKSDIKTKLHNKRPPHVVRRSTDHGAQRSPPVSIGGQANPTTGILLRMSRVRCVFADLDHNCGVTTTKPSLFLIYHIDNTILSHLRWFMVNSAKRSCESVRFTDVRIKEHMMYAVR